MVEVSRDCRIIKLVIKVFDFLIDCLGVVFEIIANVLMKYLIPPLRVTDFVHALNLILHVVSVSIM